MKLLRVISSMNPEFGGPSQGIRNSIPVLEKLGISNEVVSLDDPDAAFIAKDPFRIHAIGAGSGPWFHHKELEPWLKENLGRFDAVIIHGLWLYPSYATVKVWVQMKRKGAQGRMPRVYVMPHGMLDPYFQKAGGRKLKAIRNWIYWNLVERRVVNESDGIIFTCEEEMRLARGTFPHYKPKKQVNVGYGTPAPPVFDEKMREAFNEKWSHGDNERFILFLGRLHSKKGIDLLIEAYSMLKRKGADLPRLVIAGPGVETEYGQHLVSLTRGNDSIVFTGMVSGAAKLGALYGCEVLILPSHQENFGISIAEALACSKPVLISDKVNIWREIKECNAGFIAHDTVEGTVELLENWVGLSESSKQELNKNARLAFEQKFAVEPFAANLKRLFVG